MSVEAHHAPSFHQTVDGDVVLGALEDVGHLGDSVDEREAAYLADLGVEGVHQVERELGELCDGAAHVAEHHHVGPMRMAPPLDDVEGNAT